METPYNVDRLMLVMPRDWTLASTKAALLNIEGDERWKNMSWPDYFLFLTNEVLSRDVDCITAYGDYDGVTWLVYQTTIDEVTGFIVFSGHPWDTEVRTAFVPLHPDARCSSVKENAPRLPETPFEVLLSNRQAELNAKANIAPLTRQ